VSAPLLIIDVGAVSERSLFDRAVAIATGLRSKAVIYCPVRPAESESAEFRDRVAARTGGFERAGLEAELLVERVDALTESDVSQIDAVQPAMTMVCNASLNRHCAVDCQALNRALLEQAKSDVWIVQRQFDPEKRIVLAAIDLDTKDSASRMRDVVLSQARRYAKTFGREAHVVHSYSTSATEDRVIDLLPRGRAGDHQKNIEKMHIERVHEIARMHGYDPEFVHIDTGDLVDNLRSLVHPMGVDTVVIGTSLRSGISHLLTGSHVTSLIDALPCDVWVVRP